jgi:hypothetical protein
MGQASNRADQRAGVAVLATLALLLQLAIPQGFMLARDAGQPAIVICTGHGPLLAVGDHGLPGKAPKQGGVCAFAGHGGTPTPAPLLALASVRFAPSEARAIAAISATPGRGLAAPPPPSQAPPTRIL